MRVARLPADVAAALGLVVEHLAWIETEMNVPVFAVQPALAAELADFGSAYCAAPSAMFVADDGTSIRGMLAVRFHDDGSAELKRMYVQPDARGQGHGRRLLRAGLDHADRFDAERVWLETIPGVMDPAIELYCSHGFRRDAMRPLVDVDQAIVMTLDDSWRAQR